VTEIGAGVTGLAEGDHVVLSWVAPCGQCRLLHSGRDARCQGRRHDRGTGRPAAGHPRLELRQRPPGDRPTRLGPPGWPGRADAAYRL